MISGDNEVYVASVATRIQTSDQTANRSIDFGDCGVGLKRVRTEAVARCIDEIEVEREKPWALGVRQIQP